jgi:hypothetical protein
MRNRFWLCGTAVLVAVALPAIAQQAAPSAQPEPALTQQEPAPTPEPATQPGAEPSPAPQRRAPAPSAADAGEAGVAEISAEDLPPPPPPIELPEHAQRDPRIVGRIDPQSLNLGATPWGGAHGGFLSTLLRRMDAPIASRWAHMSLRNALLARAPAPRLVHPVDWVGERVWLLVRMGEADAARMLVSAVDVDDFTPKMFQVSVQSALASADPPALCPLQKGIGTVEERIAPMVDAMCASLSGEPESAAAQIESARRRGRIGGIDLVLAQKVVGAGADSSRAVTVEWEPVDRLDSWRFGLATATGMVPPENLIANAPPHLRAWQARAPLLTYQQRLGSARIATGLGVFSSQALTDIYSAIYDGTGPDELSETDAWQLRLAFAGRDLQTRLAAMRRLWDMDSNSLEREASRALLARAAARVQPSAELQSDAANLIASMLAAGMDRNAARWASVVGDMEDQFADASWAMLALASPDVANLDVGTGRISDFIKRDESPNKHRSAMLVGGLVGLGRITSEQADDLNRSHGLRLERRSRWSQMIDASARLGQGGTVLALTGIGFQSTDLSRIPPSHLLHAVAALRRTDQDFTARMIAAEALSRT